MSTAKMRRPQPTWAILEGLETPASETHKLLGSIVADIEHPTHDHVPSDASLILAATSTPLEVTDQDVSTVLAGSYETSVRARLQAIFSTESTKADSSGTSVKAKGVITRSLRQHRAVFNAIIQSHKDELLQLLEQNQTGKGRGYMVVGIKTCVDADVETVTGLRQLLEGQIRPGGEAVPVVGEVSVGGLITPEISAVRRQVSASLTHTVARGERIFAIQYRQIWLKRARLFATQKVAEYGNLLPVDPRRAMFALSSEEDSSASSEEDDEDDDDSRGYRTIELGRPLEEATGRSLFTKFD